MARSVPSDERRMEVHATALRADRAILDLRVVVTPLLRATLATGDWTQVAEAKATADHLNAARRAIRRIDARARLCADLPGGFWSPGHGHAA